MSLSNSLFSTFTAMIKMQDNIKRLEYGMENLSEEIKDIDRRVVRLETIMEMARPQLTEL